MPGHQEALNCNESYYNYHNHKLGRKKRWSLPFGIVIFSEKEIKTSVNSYTAAGSALKHIIGKETVTPSKQYMVWGIEGRFLEADAEFSRYLLSASGFEVVLDVTSVSKLEV